MYFRIPYGKHIRANVVPVSPLPAQAVTFGNVCGKVHRTCKGGDSLTNLSRSADMLMEVKPIV